MTSVLFNEYMETGMVDIEHHAKKKQILMKHRIKDTVSKLMETTINADTRGGWKARLGELEKLPKKRFKDDRNTGTNYPGGFLDIFQDFLVPLSVDTPQVNFMQK